MSDDNDPARLRLAEIFDRYHRRVHAYAVSRAGGGLAEDVVSETFLVAWRRFEDLPSDPLPWLLGIARRVIFRGYREAARQAGIAEQLQVWAGAVDGDVAEGVAERAVTLHALARLSEQDRELLTLLAWHDLSPAEAARVVGCSRATFFVRLHRARKRFEQAIAVVESSTDCETDSRRVIDGPHTAPAS